MILIALTGWGQDEDRRAPARRALTITGQAGRGGRVVKVLADLKSQANDRRSSPGRPLVRPAEGNTLRYRAHSSVAGIAHRDGHRHRPQPMA